MEIIVPKIVAGLLGLNKPATKEEAYFQSTVGKRKQFLSGVEKETIAYRVHAGWSAEECLFGKKNRTGNSSPRMNIPDYLS